MDLTMMERVGDRWEKMEGCCSTGQSPQRAVVPMEEEDIAKRWVVMLGTGLIRFSRKCTNIWEGGGGNFD
jgi:hypothetical protein